MKWILIAIFVAVTLFLVSKYTGFLEERYSTYQENTTSLGDAGRIIKNLKGMKQQREKDIKKSEEDLQ